MSIKLPRDLLLVLLSRVAGAIGRGGSEQPVTSHILLSLTAGRLELAATDLQLQMRTAEEVQHDEDLHVSVPARKFLAIVKLLPDDCEVTIKALANNRLSLKGPTGRYTMATLPGPDFPLQRAIEASQGVDLPGSALRGLLEEVASSMAVQDVRYYLNGAFITIENDTLRCVASDGHRMAVAETQLPPGTTAGMKKGASLSCIVPRRSVQEVINMLGKGECVARLVLGAKRLEVHANGVVLSSNLYEGTFPDYRAVMNQARTKSATLNRSELLDAAKRASILADGRTNALKLTFSPGTLRLEASNADREQASEDVATEGRDELTIGVNIQYLIEAVGRLPGDKVVAQFMDANCSMKLFGADHSYPQHVVMPQRL